MSDLQILQIDREHRQQWNDFAAQSPHFALLQSYEWGEFKERLGWKVIRLAAQRQGQIAAVAQLFIKHAPLGLFSVGYVPRGPLVDWEDRTTTMALLNGLHSEARRHKAIFMKIEPPLLNSPQAHRQLRQHGFRASRYTNQPRATIIVDLTQGLDQVLAQMHHKTRYNIRYAVKKEVDVRIGSSADMTAFHDLMQITGHRGGFTPRSLDYYWRQWEAFAPLERIRLFVASYQEKTLAFNMSAIFGEHGVYLHGASSGEHRNLQPNHLLMWKAIQWAKAQGCRTFDLWGIPDKVGQAVCEGNDLPVADRTDGLWGVYRFKRGFSKNVVYYVSAYDYAYSPPVIHTSYEQVLQCGHDGSNRRMDGLTRGQPSMIDKNWKPFCPATNSRSGEALN